MSETQKNVRAFEMLAQFPDRGQPYKPHAEDGGVLVLQIPQVYWDSVPELHKAGRGKVLRVLVEVQE